MLRDLALKNETILDKHNGLVELGKIANEFAEQSVFEDYRLGKSKNTKRRHDADLALFSKFLETRGIDSGNLAENPQDWKGVTWGLLAAYQRWMLKEGYAITSINARVSTIKVYAKLAFKAGVFNETEYALIQTIESFSKKEQENIDKNRVDLGINTRRNTRMIGTLTKGGKAWSSTKKAKGIVLDIEQANKLKSDHPDTPIGRRDILLMCLLLDHGLRVSEVALLKVQDFDLDKMQFSFHRPKVGNNGKHKFTADTKEAARAYVQLDADKVGQLIKGSSNQGNLTGKMSERAITKRVRYLGDKLIDVTNLSAHDCRHYSATYYAEKGKSIRWMLDFFGWNTPATAMRYIESAKVSDPN